MNFFEQNLRKCTEGCGDAKFIGNALYIPLGENNMLKMQFVTLGMQIIMQGFDSPH